MVFCACVPAMCLYTEMYEWMPHAFGYLGSRDAVLLWLSITCMDWQQSKDSQGEGSAINTASTGMCQVNRAIPLPLEPIRRRGNVHALLPLPWMALMARGRGRLHAVLWCLPCLLHCLHPLAMLVAAVLQGFWQKLSQASPEIEPGIVCIQVGTLRCWATYCCSNSVGFMMYDEWFSIVSQGLEGWC